MQKILITGSNGFFGRNLVRAWQNKYKLKGVDLPPFQANNSTREPFEVNDFTTYCDIVGQDGAGLFSAMMGCDVVVHLAGKTRIGPSWSIPEAYYHTNVIGAINTFTSAQSLGVKRFIYFSSSSIYGEGPVMREVDLPDPTNPYAVSKMAAEAALTVQAVKGDTELVIVRPFTMYGDFMSRGEYGLAISKFLEAWERDEPLMLEGDGSQSRDFVHASDAVQALELIMLNGQAGEVYNIGTGTSTSIKSIADAISPMQILGPKRTGHIQKTCADIRKITALGYRPTVNLFEWLTNEKAQRKL